MELSGARCAVHPESEAALACLRCGEFACVSCSPSPSVLCVACAGRAGGARDWASIPPAPRGLRRILAFPTPFLYAMVVLAFALRSLWPHSIASATIILVCAALAFVLGVGRLVILLRARRGRLGLRAAMGQMREQRHSGATARLEEVLRAEHLDAPGRALGLYLFAANAASAGMLERALSVLEPLVRSGWRDVPGTRLLRGQGHVVLGVVKALAGDVEGGRAERAQARLGPIGRFTYSPAYADAILAARAGELDRALEELDAAKRFAGRWRLVGIERGAAVLEGFVREARGEADAAVEMALAPARRSPAGAHDGMGAAWPQMRAFLTRRLAQGPRTAGLSGDGPSGSPLTQDSTVR